MSSLAELLQKMPHGRQRIAHGAHKAHVNVDAVRSAMGLGSEATVQRDGLAEGRTLNSSFASSHQSDLSEKEEEEEDEGDQMEEVQDDDTEAVNCLADFLTLKLISKDTALCSMVDKSSVYLKGKLDVKVVRGSVEILGHTIHPLPTWTSVYSPRGYSLLYLGANGGHGTQTDISQLLVSEGVSFDEAREVQGDCVFLVKRIDSDWVKFVHRHLNVKTKMNLLNRDANLPPELQHEDDVGLVEQALDVNLVHPHARHLRLFTPGEDWHLALSSVEISLRNKITPRIVVAGGKGVGKSTFNRWLVNKLLEKSPVVLVDLDPGQAELSLPCYLSLAVLTEPLLGPNFCHQERKTELKLHLGDINVSNCPGRFLACVGQLVEHLNSREDLASLPVVVNTMGWCRGVGLMLLIDTLRLVKPTTTIQLHSRFHRKNLPYSLTPETVISSTDSWSHSKSTFPLSYNLLDFLAVPETLGRDMRARDYWGLPNPRITREMVLLGALGGKGGLSSMPVYRVPWTQVALHVAHCKVDPRGLLAALNLAMVDICTVEEKEIRRSKHEGVFSTLRRTPVTASIGWGVVRNIDSSNQVLYVATGAPAELLSKCNCLVAGANRLPDSILLSQTSKGASYLASGQENPLDLPWQRNFKPRGHAQGQ